MPSGGSTVSHILAATLNGHSGTWRSVRRPAEGGADRCHHVVGREPLAAGENHRLAGGRGRMSGGEQAAAQIVHVDQLALVAARAERDVAATLDGAEQLQQAHVARAVGFGDAHDRRFDAARELAAPTVFGFGLGAAVGIVGRRAGSARPARRARASPYTPMVLPWTKRRTPSSAGELEQAARAFDVHLAEMTLRRFGFVLGGGEMNHHVVARRARRECAGVSSSAASTIADAPALEQLAAEASRRRC